MEVPPPGVGHISYVAYHTSLLGEGAAGARLPSRHASHLIAWRLLRYTSSVVGKRRIAGESPASREGSDQSTCDPAGDGTDRKVSLLLVHD